MFDYKLFNREKSRKTERTQKEFINSSYPLHCANHWFEPSQRLSGLPQTLCASVLRKYCHQFGGLWLLFKSCKNPDPYCPCLTSASNLPPKHEIFLHVSPISFYHQWENKLDSQESTFQLSSKRSDSTEQKITQVPLVIKKEHSRAHNWEEGLMCFDTSIGSSCI